MPVLMEGAKVNGREEKQCRICLMEEGETTENGDDDDDSLNQLIEPCLCTGTMAYVHQKCLMYNYTVTGQQRCVVCGTHYRKQMLGWKPFAEWRLPRLPPNNVRGANPNGIHGFLVLFQLCNWCFLLLLLFAFTWNFGGDGLCRLVTLSDMFKLRPIVMLVLVDLVESLRIWPIVCPFLTGFNLITQLRAIWLIGWLKILYDTVAVHPWLLIEMIDFWMSTHRRFGFIDKHSQTPLGLRD